MVKAAESGEDAPAPSSDGLSAGPPPAAAASSAAALPFHVHNAASAAEIAERRARLFLEQQQQDRSDAATAAAAAARGEKREGGAELDGEGNAAKKKRADAPKPARRKKGEGGDSGRDSGKYVVRPVSDQQVRGRVCV